MGAPVDRKEFIERQLTRYRALLANFTKRNKELYFRPGKGSSLSLSTPPIGPAIISDDLDRNSESAFPEGSKQADIPFSPITTSSAKLSTFINSGKLDLTEHFNLREYPNKAILKRLEKIRIADNRYQKEFGISGAWLLGPFLIWRQSPTHAPADLMISPILKMPVDIELDSRKRWSLKSEDSNLTTNPSLRIALNRLLGIQVPEIYDTNDPTEAVKLFSASIEATSRGIEMFSQSDIPGGLPTILPRTKSVKDEEGNTIERREVSIDKDLSPQELSIYNRVSDTNFLIIDVFYVDHINATRLPLFQDYEKVIAEAGELPLISELLTGQPAPGQERRQTMPRELDRYTERENYFVVPTDSTQHGVISSAKKESAIVVQGPPGTGKSQTITNLIADKLAKGQKVLFVAEKRAALDVVFTRLKQAGIDKQSALIHSSELNRNELYASFLELADSVAEGAENDEWQHSASKLENYKSQINEYYDASITHHAASGLPASEVMALYASVANQECSDQSVALGAAFAPYVRAQQLNDFVEEINELHSLTLKVTDLRNHPWLERQSGLVVTATLKAQFSDCLTRAKSAVSILMNLKNKASDLFLGLDISSAKIQTKLLSIERPSSSDLDHLLASWKDRCRHGEEVILTKIQHLSPHETCADLIKQLDLMRMQLADTASDHDSLQTDVDASLVAEMAEYYKVPPGPFGFLFPSFWRARRIAKALLKPTLNMKTLSGTDLGRIFRNFQRFQQNFTELNSTFQKLGLQTPRLSDQHSRAILDKANHLHSLLLDTELFINVAIDIKLSLGDRQALDISSSDPLDFLAKCIELRNIMKAWSNASEELHAIMSVVSRNFKTAHMWDSLIRNGKYDQILNILTETYQRIDDCEILDKIEKLCENLEKRFGIRNFTDTALPILMNLPTTSLQANNWGALTKAAIARTWYDDLRLSSPALRGFDRLHFEKKIEVFRNAVTDHCSAACTAVNQEISRKRATEPRDNRAMALLKKEASKQRRVLYPRELMERGALATMMNLKPCWLMSPLSASQILPMVRGLFDVIIFDEASQVRVEDAIPSIYRAKSMVVVGDPKQMPPTNFFLSSQDEENLDDEEDDEVAESILDLASRVYPTEMLQWHYRSRSEALIAFSNRAFYGGRLIAPPNPVELGQDDALQFYLVNGAVFTQKSGNQVEAEKVIDELSNLLKKYPSKSIGIIAMGQAQKSALDMAIEKRMESEPAFAESVKDAENRKEGDVHVGLFIKNLENVQGDERDIIIISVGYAPSGAGKKLHRNFGPLSKTGGGRRLNVAITRAREKMHVFCSFDPNEIPTDEHAFANNPDATCFGRFLKYARALTRRQYNETISILDSFGVAGTLAPRKASRFSQDVARRLAERGHQVSLEVGSSGFYIDVAVHHPSIPGNFILGIECDGAVFHSTQYARDRDKARENLLKLRGWRIIRVWGPDWSRDWQQELARIEALIEEIRGHEDAGLPASPRKSVSH